MNFSLIPFVFKSPSSSHDACSFGDVGSFYDCPAVAFAEFSHFDVAGCDPIRSIGSFHCVLVVIRFLRVSSHSGDAGDGGVQGDCKNQCRFILLVILGSALDVLLNIRVGISLLVRVVEQYVVGV